MKRTCVKIPARRKRLSMIAAVTNQGKVRFMIYPGGFSPRGLIVFMRRLIQDARRKVLLILDSLNVHKARSVRDWLDGHADRIEVIFLLKGAIQRGIPPKDVKDLKRTTLSHSRRIQKSPARMRASFRNQHIRYTA